MSERNPHAGLPITDDDASIARALEDVSIPTLMLSMLHMTGDPELIRGPLRPQGLFLNEVQGFMSDEDQAEVRRQALEVIRAYRDGGSKLPAPPGRELLHEMMIYGRWYRFLLLWPGCDAGLVAARVDPDWPEQRTSISAANDAARILFTQWIESQLEDRPDLVEKVVPDYPATGKRTLQDNGSWLGALKRDTVELVREGIDHIERDAIVTTDGRRFEVDIIVCATGFHANQMLSPMRIEGRDGVVLSEHWGDRPAAYLGMTVPGFPNLFCMYGPGTNLAHGGSLIFHSECQIRYITGCLKAMIEGGHRTLEPRQSVHDYYVRLQKELEGMVWSHPAIEHSWYKNAEGKIHILSPWRLVDYWAWTREPDLGDFEIA